MGSEINDIISCQDDAVGLQLAQSGLNTSYHFLMNNTYITNSTFGPAFFNKVLLSNIAIDKTLIIFGKSHTIVRFINCTLNFVQIKDQASNAKILSQIIISIEGCTFYCGFTDKSIPNGIELHNNQVYKVTILQTKVRYCKVSLLGSSAMINITECTMLHSDLDMSVQSFLKIPSIIYLDKSEFIQNLSQPEQQMLSFQLQNPYILIYDCHLNGSSLEIMSKKYQYQQGLFSLQIIRSSFSLAHKGGKGGAILISSDVKSSTVTLSSLTFMGNKVDKISESNSGKGGAVFVEGGSLFLMVTDCVFIDNSAYESGSALYTTQGVTLFIKNTSFMLDLDSEITTPIVSSLGQVTTLVVQINIKNNLPDIYIGGFRVITFQQILDYVMLSVLCPPWHRHIVEYELEFVDSYFNSVLPLNNVVYECAVCNEDYYTTSDHKNILTYPAYNSSIQTVNQVPESNLGCRKCPYGALCSGNDVKPRANYWGY